MNTYTPAGGYTPAAQGVQSMADTLASITGSPAAGAYLAAAQGGPNYSQTNVPQLANEEDKLRTMFANDQALAARYQNPNLYGGGAVPPAGNPAGAFSSPLQATIDSITNPQGAVTPGGVTGQITGEIGGQSDALSRVMDAMNFDQPRTLDAYKSMVAALADIYNTEKQYGGGSDQDFAADAYLEQVKAGLKLTSVPVDIRSLVVTKMKQQGLTVDSIAKGIEGKPIIQNISDLKDLWDKIPPIEIREGPIAKLIGGAKQAATIFGYESNLRTYNKKRDIMISSLRQLVKQGGNMSNKDMLRIENGLAKITDAPAVSDQTWNEIVHTLENVYGDKVVAENFSASLPGGTGGGTIDNVSSLPRLTDPSTGKTYEYDSKTDPDYISDLANGFRPQ